MPSLLEFQPDYQFYCIKQDGSAYVLNTMLSCTASNSTTSVGQLTATFADPHGVISNLTGSNGQSTRPQAMDVVQLRLRNRHGEWGVAWTGYVDAYHQLFSADQGDIVQIAASSPYKLWEVVRQNPGDTVRLSLYSATGITGSAILTLSAQAVGYPIKNIVIDPQANSGAFLWGQISAGIFTNPDQQTWSSIIQALVGDSGLEMFFDEEGFCYWRRMGYLADTPGYFMPDLFPRTVQEEEILQLDLAETDQGVVTEVEVRYGLVPITQLAPYVAAPASMAQHLKTRRLVLYAPWIRAKQAAQTLAQQMLNVYASNILVGSVTIPADPLFRIGKLVDVPIPNAGATLNTPGLKAPLATGRYYMTNTTYNLEWGQSWVMTLGLAYGRAADQSFPYIGSLTYPVITQNIQKQFLSGSPTSPTSTQLLAPLASSQPGPYTIATNPVLQAAPYLYGSLQATSANTISLDCTDLNITAGAVVQLRDPVTSAPIGPSPTGEYVVVDAGRGSPTTITIQSNPTNAPVTNILVVKYQSAPIGYDSGNTDPAGSTSVTNTNVTPVSTGANMANPPQQPASSSAGGMQFPVQPPYSITQAYGPTSYAGEPAVHGYPHFHTGIDIGIPTGTPVYAATGGVVIFAQWDTTGFGNCVRIVTGNTMTLYGHLSSFNCAAGDSVKQGQLIAQSDSTGNSSGPHLHFEIESPPGFGNDQDPALYLPNGSIGTH